jgi:hypothetical protein
LGHKQTSPLLTTACATGLLAARILGSTRS